MVQSPFHDVKFWLVEFDIVHEPTILFAAPTGGGGTPPRENVINLFA